MQILEDNKYVTTSPYGWRILNGKKDFHTGIDMVKPPNNTDWIVSPSRLKVVIVKKSILGFLLNSYGNQVVLEDAKGIKIRFAHLKYGTIKVKVGDIVEFKSKIGYMGKTGTSYGEHLHFEVIKNSKQIDPKPYLDDKKKLTPIAKPSPKPTIIKVGDKVKITGKYYSDSKIKIPVWVKLKKYKVIQVATKKVLLEKIMSWVDRKDVKKV